MRSANHDSKASRSLRQQEVLRQAHHLNLNGQSDVAENIARTVLDETPSNAEALFLLGLIRFNNRYYEDAKRLLEKALRKNPKDARALARLAETHQLLGNGEKAMQSMAKAVRLQPDFKPFIAQLANMLAENGRRNEALDRLKQALSRWPDDPSLLIAYGQIARFEGHEPELSRLGKIAKRQDLDISTLFRAGSAYSRALDHLGKHEQAVAEMVSARALMPPFNMKRYHDESASRKAVFTSSFIEEKAALGSQSKRPVFIIGMPRSGTSLVEQIIASHPQAFGAGELPDMGLLVNDIAPQYETVQAQLEFLKTLKADQAKAMSDRYLSKLSAIDAKAARITDKMPQNFNHLGEIAILFPQASIIHCRRDPVDTCLSCFLSGLSMNHNYTRDIETLAAYWQEYDSIMDHFTRTLGNQILSVDYERLVSDTDVQARQIIDHIDLDWNPACLEFWKTERRVSTLSSDQVRRPVYSSSVGRSSKYGQFADKLRKALK